MFLLCTISQKKNIFRKNFSEVIFQEKYLETEKNQMFRPTFKFQGSWNKYPTLKSFPCLFKNLSSSSILSKYLRLKNRGGNKLN